MSNNRRGNFIGHNGFVWWIGVIEDRMDPLNLGRCRVRIQGLHEGTKAQVPTNTLPWAQPLFSINGSTSTPSTLQEGDFVMGFFMDGASSQYPIIMGMFHGIPEDSPDREKGFNDPRTDEQLKAAPRKPQTIDYSTKGGAKITEYPAANTYPNRLDQPTTSRLSRNESIDTTIVKAKNDSVKKAKGPKGATAWTEPNSPYNTKYPYNQVVSTESGHYFELDDSPGHERIHLYHRSGTFSETHPDGSQVEKIVKDRYTVVLNNDKVSISGDCSVTIEGSNKVYIIGNCDTTIDGNYTMTINGNMTTTVAGTINQTSSGATNIKGSPINLN
jgi:hypothetical protein